jgi:hypothetical protein
VRSHALKVSIAAKKGNFVLILGLLSAEEQDKKAGSILVKEDSGVGTNSILILC